MNIKVVSNLVGLFVKKAQQMTATQAFDPGDIIDALRSIGLVDQGSLHFGQGFLVDRYNQDPTGMQISVTLHPTGNVDVSLGDAFQVSNLKRNFGMYARKAMELTNANKIKAAVQQHFKNRGLALPAQPTTVVIPS